MNCFFSLDGSPRAFGVTVDGEVFQGGGVSGVTGPGASIDGHIASYNGTDGDTLKDQGLRLHTPVRSATTGLIAGGLISVNGGDPAKVDITLGLGQIVDYKTDPLAPTIVYPSWTAFTAVTITGIGSQPATAFYINAAGAIVQLANQPTATERRTLVFLGSVLHASGNVDVISNTPLLASAADLTGYDFYSMFGQLSRSGSVYFGDVAGNKLASRTAGVAWLPGGNAHTDANNPNFPSVAAVVGITDYVYLFGDGGGTGGSLTTTRATLDPDILDDGSGVLAVVANNKWTVQVGHFSADNPNTLFVEAGQTEYASDTDAIAGRFDITVEASVIKPLIRRVWIIAKKGSTDYSDPLQAVFVEIPESLTVI